MGLEKHLPVLEKEKEGKKKIVYKTKTKPKLKIPNVSMPAQISHSF